MQLTGTSRSGVATSLYAPELKLVFDVGFTSPETIRFPRVFITHGHIDHIAGAVQHASTRDMMGMSHSEFFIPAHNYDNFVGFLKAAQKLNEGAFKFSVTPMTDLIGVALGDKKVVPFRTDHRVPSLGYKVFTTKSKLKPELVGLPHEELHRLRTEEGVELSKKVSSLALAYVGDSRATVLDTNPDILQADTLVMEATFVGDFPLEEARERGHTHLSELAERAELFKDVKTLVLTHFSMRHSEAEVLDAVEKLPESLQGKVHLIF